ncbi:MAG: L-arabinose isomerase [candidate division BRC1 bacterium ADurb.BinA364]|nr:MAG: L-arabinose isomerase [candidate division BRC1 bacterium ADurb.BinA364]
MDKIKTGVLLTLSDLYRQRIPAMPAEFAAHWTSVLAPILAEAADPVFTAPAHSGEELAARVAECEAAGCDLLLLLPMAYASSGAAREALADSRTPLLLVSTARDFSLPVEMAGEHLIANQGVHGIQDAANALWRAGRRFHLIAGHPGHPGFRDRILRILRAAAGAAVLRRGRIGRLGEPFEGMLDFTFDAANQRDALGFSIAPIEPADLERRAKAVAAERVAQTLEWAATTFDVDAELTGEELEINARWSLALEDLAEAERLDGLAMCFLALARAGARTMPFLGASRLMARGVGYAGEGDALTAALAAALARMAGQATFTEMFCADYASGEILLSHMGECNFALAHPGRRVRLMAREFAWGRTARLAVPVFQLRPGEATLVCLGETPPEAQGGAKSFRLLAVRGEIAEAPEHPNLRNPYSRIRFGGDLDRFLERYSRAGGGHHLALAYGDLFEEIEAMADFCQIRFEALS